MESPSASELIAQVCHDARRHRILWTGNSQDDDLRGVHPHYDVELTYGLIPLISTHLIIKVYGFAPRRVWLNFQQRAWLREAIFHSRNPKEGGMYNVLEAMQQWET